MTRNEQQMYSDVTSIRESLQKIANALETNVTTTPKPKDIPGFEGTLDALDILCDIKTITDDYSSTRKVILEQQALNRKIKAKEKSAYKKTFSIFNWYISENHYVEVFYDVIPKDYGDRETPSYPQYVEVSSMTLYGDDVTELFEHRIEEIEHEINNEIE